MFSLISNHSPHAGVQWVVSPRHGWAAMDSVTPWQMKQCPFPAINIWENIYGRGRRSCAPPSRCHSYTRSNCRAYSRRIVGVSALRPLGNWGNRGNGTQSFHQMAQCLYPGLHLIWQPYCFYSRGQYILQRCRTILVQYRNQQPGPPMRL